MLGRVALPSWALAAMQSKASRCQRCWHVRACTRPRTCAASQGQELASPSDLHPRVGLPNSRAGERLHQPQVTPGAKHWGRNQPFCWGKHHFASGTCSGAGLAWQETPRVAELQQSQRGVSKKVPIVTSGKSSSVCLPHAPTHPAHAGQGRLGFLRKHRQAMGPWPTWFCPLHWLFPCKLGLFAGAALSRSRH